MPEERKVFVEIVSRFVVEYQPHAGENDEMIERYLMNHFAEHTHDRIQGGSPPRFWDSELLESAVFVEEPSSDGKGTIYHYVRYDPEAKYLNGK